MTLDGINRTKRVAITDKLPTRKIVGEVVMVYALEVSRLWHIIKCPLLLQQCREAERTWRGGCFQAAP
jgi:hypothetical protein